MDAAVYRPGNFMLTEAALKRGIGNKLVREKKLHYGQSTFQIMRKIAAQNEKWTLDRLAERQRWRARQTRRLSPLDTR